MKNRRLIFIILLMIGIISQLEGKRFATWYTSMGNFKAILHEDIVPITANNFITLANSHFYDHLIFHRVVAGFVIQDGDPLGTGYGGPGYTIPDEFSPLLSHDSPGVLAMAHSSLPNSAGSQYYITLAPTLGLDGDYAIFGKVFEGLDVVLAIGLVPVGTNSKPITNVNIDSLRISPLCINSTTPETDTLYTIDQNTSMDFYIDAFDVNMVESVTFEWKIDNQVIENDIESLTYQFDVAGSHSVSCQATLNDISYPIIWQVNVNPTGNQDQIINPPSLVIKSCIPNPFKEQTIVKYTNSKKIPVQVNIYNIKGQLMKSEMILSGKSGDNEYLWNGRNSEGERLASGIYFIKIADSQEATFHKVLLLK